MTEKETFQVGDEVEIVGPDCRGLDRIKIGTHSHIIGLDHLCPTKDIFYVSDEGILFPASSLRLVARPAKPSLPPFSPETIKAGLEAADRVEKAVDKRLAVPNAAFMKAIEAEQQTIAECGPTLGMVPKADDETIVLYEIEIKGRDYIIHDPPAKQSKPDAPAKPDAGVASLKWSRGDHSWMGPHTVIGGWGQSDETFSHDEIVNHHNASIDAAFSQGAASRDEEVRALEAERDELRGKLHALESASEGASQVVIDIAIERYRQVSKGFDAAHDDQHTKGELMQAAATYINSDIQHYPRDWGNDEKVLKTLGKDKRQDFIKGIAFLVAELERMDRATATKVEVKP